MHPSDYYSVAEKIIALAFLVFCFNLPLFVYLAVAQKSAEQLAKPEFENMIGATYERIDTKRFYAVMNIILFLVRRIALVMVVCLYQHKPMVQMVGVGAIQASALIYTVTVRPFNQKHLNAFEIFNEVCVTVTIGLVIAMQIDELSDYFRLLGMATCGVIYFNVVVNMIIIISKVLQELNAWFENFYA
jgi:hypothetical protein